MTENNKIDTLPPVNYPVMHLAAGTAFLDEDVKNGIEYTYSIKYYPDGTLSDTRSTKKITLPVKSLLEAPIFNSKNIGNGKIYIEWYERQNPLLYSFRVYRRHNMAGNFEKIVPVRGFYNKGDSLFMVITDNGISPRDVYEYYIEPIDRLENPGPASVPAVVSSFTTGDIPVIRRFDVTTGNEDHSIGLYWRFSNPDLVRSISIFRSAIYDSSYLKIAEVPATDSTYTDHVTGAMENYYYYLVLQGIMDRSYPSAKVGGHSTNSSQPLPPDDVGAEDIKGGVKLYWKNLDPDIRGYYIYRDQGVNDSLQQVSALIPASGELMSYVDSSKTLTGNNTYRYAVVSVSDGYLRSSVSTIVTARPSIKTRVLSPGGITGGFLDGKVQLVWDDMNPEDQFLVGYNVYRRENNDKFVKVNRELLPFNNNTYSDTTISMNKIYQYAITSIDESGSESPPGNTLRVGTPEGRSIPPSPYGLRVSKNNESILLTWPAETIDSDNKIRIFRYMAGQKPVLIAEVGADIFSYTDKSVSRGNLYFYYMTVVTPLQQESGQGEKVNIRF